MMKHKKMIRIRRAVIVSITVDGSLYNLKECLVCVLNFSGVPMSCWQLDIPST